MTIDPPGPLYLPIVRQRNISCSVENGLFSQIEVIFSDKMPESYIPVSGMEVAMGLTVISANSAKLFMSIDTNDTSIIGIICKGNIQTGTTTTRDEFALNITIYGEL